MKKIKYITMLVSFVALLIGINIIGSHKVISASDKIKISEKNFPDEQLRSMIKGIDKNKDGYLSKKEREIVKKVVIYKDKLDEVVHYPELYANKEPVIFNCKGLQYFYNLKILDITMIDEDKDTPFPQVLNIDKIRKLKNLEKLRYNGRTGAKTLDFRGNTALKKVQIYGDRFKYLKLDNPKLKEIYILGSRLRTLDLRKAKKVTFVRYQQGELEKIKLSSKNKIKYIELGYNKIKILDTSMFNKKTLLNIEITGNPIKKIDISKLDNLRSIDYSSSTKIIKTKKQKRKVIFSKNK